MEGAEEEVAGAVAGKEAAGAVGPVRRWGEAEHDYAGVRVPEARYGTAPVLFVRVGGLLLASDPLAPLDEARAAPARGYLRFELRERVRERAQAPVFLFLFDAGPLGAEAVELQGMAHEETHDLLRRERAQ